MSVRFLMLALAAGVLAAGPSARADNARPRSGGSSPSSSAGAQHHSGGSSSPQSSGSSGSSDNSSTPSSGRSTAEQRHPRAGTGTADWPHHGYGYYPGYYPGWYYPYWPSYYYGAYAGWGPYGGYGPGPGYYSYRTGGDSAALRVLVEPEKAKVYVDGYYAGVADDFDGMFQRLYVAPGRHEITLKYEGYRTHRMLVYVTPGQTMKIQRDLERGPGDETFEDLTGGRGQREETVERRPDRDYDQPPDRGGYEPETALPPPRGGDEPYRADAGRLRLDVRPRDASVYVDGTFQGPAGDLGELMLPPGPHRVEVVRPGFRTEERDVQLAPGSSRTVTIELVRP
jgi:PEGA domain-containing protein